MKNLYYLFACTCVLGAIATHSTTLQAQSTLFGGQQIITQIPNPYSVYATDLDNDGDADVLSASTGDDKIAWYENEGSGNFGVQQIITTAADGASSVYAADLDNDGDMDVLSASYLDDKIAWYENEGSGNFGAQQIITTAADVASSVYAADLDNDGDADVLSASRGDNKIAWYENDGSGNFGAQQIITTAADGANSVYAADLDNDGDMDVLSASFFDDEIVWYANDGSGNFGAQQIITTVASGAESVYAADLDNDGDADVLSASRGDDKIAWYENDGSGNFGAQQIITTAADVAYSVYAADLDGDGDLDVLSASTGDDKIAWYANDGSGNFGAQQIITTAANEAYSVYAADLDNDGDSDVLSASIGDDKIAWYENDGSGNFGTQQIITTGANGARSVYAADLDDDGDLDVLSASRDDDKIAWYANDGSGNFGAQQIITTAASGAESVYAADLDGDSDLDVLSASSVDNKIAWYENEGSGNFGAQQIITTAANGARSVYAADLDGDGDADVLSTSSDDDKIAWYENEGSGNFGAQQIITTAANLAYSVYAADLDNDGDSDVLSASYLDSKIAWYENGGSGNFGAQQIITTAAEWARSVYAADLDNDGDADVLSASAWDGEIAWYENGGSGNFGAQQIITTVAAEGASSVYAADLDNDGDLDVLSASYVDSKIAWYKNLLELSINIFINNPPCIGAANGSVWVQVGGGNALWVPPYSYTWTNTTGASGSGTATNETFTIDDLAAGEYTIILTNALGDADTAGVLLNTVPGSVFEIINISTTNSSNALPNGAIQLSIDGGTAPYTITWSGMASGSYASSDSVFVINNLFAGTYNINITDAEGRAAGHTVTLLDETTPASTCGGIMDIVILNDSSGSVDETEYSESKTFFVDLVNALNIGIADTESRAAIVEWSGSGEQQIRVPMTGNIAELQDYLYANRAFGGGTNPNSALTYGYNYLADMARPEAIKVLVLSTDGYSGQVSGSLVAIAETYKAQGYIIVTVAFDVAFAVAGVRDLLTQTASLPMLAPGAPAYSMLTPTLAYNIVNLYICPADPGSSNTYYFYRDGAIDMTGYTPNDFCPNPASITVHYTVSAQQQLSLPAGTPITFYYNNPALFSSTPILTTFIPCAIPAGSSETFSTTLPVTGAANIWAVLNDDGSQAPPINLPITSIDEHVYINNWDNIAVCTEPLPTLSAHCYTTTPQPICGNTVIYTVDVCNISELDATQVQIGHLVPAGFALISQSTNYNACASDGTAGAISYDIPAGCCVSITYEYDVSAAGNGLYNDVDVALSGLGGQIYFPYNGSGSSAEDVTIDGTVNCPSSLVILSKVVNTTEVCEESFVSYTFTVDNQTDVSLQNLSFADTLPSNIIWAAEPYLVDGMSIGTTNIIGTSAANFVIAELPAHSVGSFVLDAYLGDWQDNGTLDNTAILGNLPAFVNDNGNPLEASAETVVVNALPQIDALNLVEIVEGEVAILSADAPSGTLITWATSGDGTISSPNSLQTFYTPGAGDIVSGEVRFTVAAVSPFNDCGQDIDTVLLLINPPPTDTSTLAITLLHFGGIAQSEGNYLEWLTTAEVNNDHFILWRADQAGAEFRPIARIAAQGTSNSQMAEHYDYLDRQAPKGTCYYRLQWIDHNGKTQQSHVIALSRNDDGSSSAQAYVLSPNPTHDLIYITQNSTQQAPQAMPYALYNTIGQAVLHGTYTQAIQSLSLAHLPLGIYYLHLGGIVTKVVKR